MAGLNRNEEALAAFQKALDRGTNVQRTHVRMAGLEAKLGHKEAAVTHFVAARKAHLENAEQVLMGTPDLMALLSDPKAGPALFPKLPDNASREAKWKADLTFFRTRFLETHYPFFDQVDRATWEGRLDALEADIPKLENWQLSLRLNQIVRMTKAGHTLVVPPFLGPDTFHLAPVMLHKFSDGWYVRAAASEHKDLVGRRVLKVGNRTPEEALTLLEPLVPHDNASGLQWSAGTFMAIPEYLAFLGVLPSREALVLTLEDDESSRTVTIPAKPLNPQSMQAFGQVRHLPPGYASARAENKLTPLWLKEPERAFWCEVLPAQKALYVQLNRVQDDGKESLADFTRRLFTIIEAQKGISSAPYLS